MRKKTYLPLLALVLLLSLSAICQRWHSPFLPELNYLQKNNLRGAVKSIDVKKYIINGKEGLSFNVSQTDYIITSIDKKGNETKEEKIYGNGSRSNTIVYQFNNKGQEVGHIFYTRGEVVEKQVKQFNNKGNQVGLQFFRKNGEIRKRWVFQLYADGRAKEIREYDSKDTLTFKALFWYYKVDNKTEEKWYGKGGVFQNWYGFTFNDKGLLIEEKRYEEGGGPIGRILFTYDARDNLLERLESVRNANNTTRYVYTYDENDNITSEKKYDKEEKLIETKTYAYTYDDKGNWLEKLEYINGIEKNIDKRTVAYY